MTLALRAGRHGAIRLARRPWLDWIPALALGLAAVSATTEILRRGGVPGWLDTISPLDVGTQQGLAAAADAITFAALAVALLRRKGIAWGMAGLLLLAGTVQAIGAREEAGAVVGGTALLALAVRRPSYRVAAPAFTGRVIVAVGVAGALVSLVIGLAGSTANGVLGLIDVSVGWLIGPEGPTVGRVATAAGVIVWILAALRAAALLATVRSLGPAAEPRDERTLDAEARRLADEVGRGPLLPFQLDTDKCWYRRHGRSLVAYGRAGRTAVVVGDPIAPPERQVESLLAFARACAERDWTPTIYQASTAVRDGLGQAGWHGLPVGREAIVDLAGFSLAGSARANLRHTIARAERAGVRVDVELDGLAPDDLQLEGLAAVDRTWRRGRPPMRFTIHEFDRAALASAIVAIATCDGIVVAFATIRRTGADGGAVLDLMRRRPGSPPGSLEACLAAAAAALRDRGVATLSLGLAPLSGLDPASPRASERALARFARAIRPFYDVAGLAFFKAKFAPSWHERWLLAPRRRDLPGACAALLWLHLRGPAVGRRGPRATLAARSGGAVRPDVPVGM